MRLNSCEQSGASLGSCAVCTRGSTPKRGKRIRKVQVSYEGTVVTKSSCEHCSELSALLGKTFLFKEK